MSRLIPSSSDAAPYLKSSRLRFFGGTTNHWGGYCRPLDPLDFEVRPWVAESGWPFGREELDPYYRRAEEVLQIRAFAPQAAIEAATKPHLLLPLESEVEPALFRISPPTRFGPVFRDELVRSPAIHVVLHANALRLECDRDGRRVKRVVASTLEGKRLEVRARRFVLAAGGIENPRLLLLSDDLAKRGLGNQNDLVGRYFMEHPHLTAVDLAVVGRRKRLPRYFGEKDGNRVLLRLSDSRQRRDGLLNCAFRLDNRRASGPREPLGPPIARLVSDLDALRQEAIESQRLPVRSCRAMAMCEQAPNPASRVTLGEERDRLGLRKVRLEWKLTHLDLESLRASMGRLGHAFGAWGVGRLAHAHDSEELLSLVAGGNHHMGTTRMHVDPRRGVVDADCRVHELANLYVAGSSVFPTCGCSNPTLTLVALALRLGDHLAGSPRD